MKSNNPGSLKEECSSITIGSDVSVTRRCIKIMKCFIFGKMMYFS